MPGTFKTTSWTVVLTAKQEDDLASRDALQSLCESYWPPLYSYVRHRGYSIESAKDLTQEFFATLLAKNYLHDVEPAKGRFRSFLLVALNHFLANEHDRNQTLKRGGGQIRLSLDVLEAERRYILGPPHMLSAEAIFDAEWARTIIQLALTRLEAEYGDQGKSRLFDTLRSCLSGARSDRSYQELADTLGITMGAVKVAVHRLRKRYGILLRDEVAKTLERPENIEEELRYLAAAAGL
ncbi:MAG: hypothetical protein AMXMBFR82_20410 [Candidatus Hydrogenedentota bacterium]